MKIIEDILDYSLSLDRQEQKKYMLVLIASITVILSGITYFVYYKSVSLRDQIDDIKILSKKSNLIARSYKKIQVRKSERLQLLDQEKNFDMKSFFENYYKSIPMFHEHNFQEQLL